jgi:hypothetical protein
MHYMMHVFCIMYVHGHIMRVYMYACMSEVPPEGAQKLTMFCCQVDVELLIGVTADGKLNLSDVFIKTSESEVYTRPEAEEPWVKVRTRPLQSSYLKATLRCMRATPQYFRATLQCMIKSNTSVLKSNTSVLKEQHFST